MAFDLDYLRSEKSDETPVVCELGGKAPTKKVLVYRFICRFEDSMSGRPVVMDIEEGVYDEACRTGQWDVIEKKTAPPLPNYSRSIIRSGAHSKS